MSEQLFCPPPVRLGEMLGDNGSTISCTCIDWCKDVTVSTLDYFGSACEEKKEELVSCLRDNCHNREELALCILRDISYPRARVLTMSRTSPYTYFVQKNDGREEYHPEYAGRPRCSP